MLGGAAGAGDDEPDAGRRATSRRDARGAGATPEEDLLGVEIEITPAGKAMKRLTLLSGGEKSMTALAFLFSVFLARPCPFYILDEVEAALDDLNIDRFLELLRAYSQRAQFIVVTHQKRTMEAADSLYGVSMGGDGISKVISRRLPARGGVGRLRHGARLAGPVQRRRRAWPRLAGSVHRRRRAPRDPRTPAVEERRVGRFRRLRENLRKTRQALQQRDPGDPVRGAQRRDLGAAGGGADLRRRRRVARPPKVVEQLEQEATEGGISGGEALTDRLIELLAEIARTGDDHIDLRAKPTVILVAGVNGTGKTTTIGKLA